MARFLIVTGIILVLAGLLWPWLSRLGIGRLPGDIVIRRGNVTFYLPITTSIVVSLILTLVLWFMKR